MKICKSCKKAKELDEFGVSNRTKDLHMASCKACESAKAKIYYAKHKEQIKERCRANWKLDRTEWPEKANEYRQHKTAYRITKYGISLEEHAKLLTSQNDSCAICKLPFNDARPSHIDHDHKTGKVRGLLCKACNTGLGNFRDNSVYIEKAIAYLKLEELGGASSESV